ncbi:dnaJ homolog subfamily C member 7 isoform X2 [Hydra vulgaris]|uniref:DnaJ homolog subfamily C member 7 isoform X2 n=1 Tax=Hydra vulgaris TaxID=6087 RepID=A0ABM4C1B3_HYDVU
MATTEVLTARHQDEMMDIDQPNFNNVICDNDSDITDTEKPTPVDPKVLSLTKKEQGNEAYSQKNYTKAVQLYTEAINLDPSNAAYYCNRAAAYMMYQEFKLALEDSSKAIALDNKFVKAYHRSAKCYIATGQVEHALRMIEAARNIEPKNKLLLDELRAVKTMADYESQSAKACDCGDYRKIEFCMRRLLEFAPYCVGYKCLQAECLALLGKFNDAQVIANEVLRKDSNNADALFVRGLCLYYQDQTERACKLFQQLLKVDPDFKKAKEAYKKAKSLESLKGAGNNAFRDQKYTEACDFYTNALKVDPLNVSANSKIYCNRATVNYKLGQIENSIKDSTSAIELDPTYLKAYLRRAKCYMDTEKFQEAVNDYEKICKMDHSADNRNLLKEAKLELKKSKRKDYYKILGIPKSAQEADIKKAYRKEALKHHPDRHSNSTDEEKKKEEIIFKEIGEAYSVLSDPQKKQRYDSGQDLEECGMDMGGFDPNLIFQTFFGGGGGGFHSRGGQHSQFPGGFSFSFG